MPFHKCLYFRYTCVLKVCLLNQTASLRKFRKGENVDSFILSMLNDTHKHKTLTLKRNLKERKKHLLQRHENNNNSTELRKQTCTKFSFICQTIRQDRF